MRQPDDVIINVANFLRLYFMQCRYKNTLYYHSKIIFLLLNKNYGTSYKHKKSS